MATWVVDATAPFLCSLLSLTLFLSFSPRCSLSHSLAPLFALSLTLSSLSLSCSPIPNNFSLLSLSLALLYPTISLFSHFSLFLSFWPSLSLPPCLILSKSLHPILSLSHSMVMRLTDMTNPSPLSLCLGRLSLSSRLSSASFFKKEKKKQTNLFKGKNFFQKRKKKIHLKASLSSFFPFLFLSQKCSPSRFLYSSNCELCGYTIAAIFIYFTFTYL